jgi:hypothetical protein
MGMLVPKTCRVNELHILSHLVGSLPYTMSAIHGHMNIKVKRLIKFTHKHTFLSECCVNKQSDLYDTDFLRQLLNHLVHNGAQSVVMGSITKYNFQMNHWFNGQSQKYITPVHWEKVKIWGVVWKRTEIVHYLQISQRKSLQTSVCTLTLCSRGVNLTLCRSNLNPYCLGRKAAIFSVGI